MATKQSETKEAKRVMVCKTGNLTRDPELKFSPKGTAWAKATIAVNPWVRDKDGGHRGEAIYYDVRFFGSLAEHMAETASKGDRVIVYGQGTVEEYTAKDGTAKTAKVILANDGGIELRFNTAVVQRATRSTPDTGDDSTSDESDDF